MKCEVCRRELEDATDVFELQEGIIGLRGVVPLSAPLLFCSVACLRNYFNGAGRVYKARRKVP